MKRTKEWWARLNRGERIRLVYLERMDKKGGAYTSFYPDDCVEGHSGGAPAFGEELGIPCDGDLAALLDKANGVTIRHPIGEGHALAH